MTNNVVEILKFKKMANKVKGVFHRKQKPMLYINIDTLMRIIEHSDLGQAFFKGHNEFNMLSWEFDIQGSQVFGITLKSFASEEVPPKEE